MFRFNIVGGVMLAIGALVGGTLSAFGVEPRWAGTIGASIMLVADVIYRWRKQAPGVNPWFDVHSGGFLALGPSWIIGLILVIGAQFGLFN